MISFHPAARVTTDSVSCILGGVISPPAPGVHGPSLGCEIIGLAEKSLRLVPMPHPTRMSNITVNKNRNPKK